MTAQKLVFELMGKTLLIPLEDSTISFTNTSFEIYAPNFHQRLDKQDIQNIYLLDNEHATAQEVALVNHLPRIGDKQPLGQSTPSQASESSEKSDQTKQTDHTKKSSQEKDMDLRSGVI